MKVHRTSKLDDAGTTVDVLEDGRVRLNIPKAAQRLTLEEIVMSRGEWAKFAKFVGYCHRDLGGGESKGA